MGRGKLGIMTLRRMIEEGFEVPVIITCDHSTEVGSSPEEFKAVAQEQGIDYFHTNHINKPEWIERLSSYNAQIGVALLWLYIISDDVISTTKHGLLNFHGGDLPRYRGNACGNWAILEGENKMGLTVHQMEPGVLDSGPVVIKDYLPIMKDTTIGELTEEATNRGVELLIEALKLFRDGKATPAAQDVGRALYCYPRLPRDGEIDWNQSAEGIYDLIRAAGRPYPGAYTYYRDGLRSKKIRKMVIYCAHVESHSMDFLARPGHLLRLEDGDKWAVACGGDNLLVLDEIEVDGKNVKPSEYFKSIRTRLGLNLSDEVVRLDRELKELKKRLKD